MKTITVINLATGKESVYAAAISESEAVTYAHLESIGNNNTWEYPRLCAELNDQLVWGKHTVAMGDFCTLRESVEDIHTCRN